MSVYQEKINSLFSRLERQLVKSASKPLPRNIHRLRTALRRVEAVLIELSPELDRNQHKLLKLLTRLRRRAGKVRDVDVQVTALRGLKVSDEPGRKTQILASLADLRASREKRFVKVLDREHVQELRKRLNRGNRTALRISAPDPLVLATHIFETLARENQTLNETSLHQYRINGKRARYIAELAGDEPDAQRFVGHLKQLQDVLGEWHDWLTLSQTVAQFNNSGRNSPMTAALSNITRAKFHEALQAVSTTKAALLSKVAGPKPSGTTPKKSAPAEPRAVAAVA